MDAKTLANNFELWGEYVDPDATMTQEQFDALTEEEKIALVNEIFPDES